MLKNSIDFFQKYQGKDGTIPYNDLSKYKPVSVQNLNEMEKSAPVKFKNTLMLIRYASDIDNARMNIFNRKAGNYSNVNFGILNLLNAANYYSSFSFLNHNISASTFNLGYMSSGDNDALRIAMSGFYEDKGAYIKNGKHYDVNYDTISYSPEMNYLRHKGF